MSNPKNTGLGSDANLESNHSKSKKRKNIRNLYIKSVLENKSVKGGLIRSKNLTNLDDSILNKSSSSYLTNEYNLVKKILNATKALEKLKNNNTNEFMARTSAPKYKTQEEYYEEILELKKVLYFLSFYKFIVENRLNFSSRDSKKLNLSINKDGQRSA